MATGTLVVNLWPAVAWWSTHDPLLDGPRPPRGCVPTLIALAGLAAMAIATTRRRRPLPADARIGRWRAIDAPRCLP
jgi:hypothetical protein